MVQKMTLKEQKAQGRVLDHDSAVTASVRTNSQLVPDELSDAPLPLQTSDAWTDSPVSSFLSSVNKNFLIKSYTQLQEFEEHASGPSGLRAQHKFFESFDKQLYFMIQKLTVKEHEAQVRGLNDDCAVTASARAKSQQVSDELSDAPNLFQSSDALTDSPVVSSGSKAGFTLQFSLKDLLSRRKLRLSRLQSISDTSGRIKLKGYVECYSLI